MTDESGNAVAVPSVALPAESPELCSAEFRPPGDSRIAIGRAGAVVCYFKSDDEVLGTVDVHIDVGGKIVQSHTISSLGDGVWQANILPDEAIAIGTGVRLRLGNGTWSERLPLRQTT